MAGRPHTVDDYLAAVRDDKRAALETLRKNIGAAAPNAEECLTYQLPAFRLDGKMLVAFGATAKHCAFYPMSASTIEAHKEELKGYHTSKGTIRFQAANPLPATLVRKLVKARIAENAGARAMSPETLKSLDLQKREQWRTWLARHHHSESEVWLVFHKRQTGRRSIAYDEAVDEALCFGWIDSLIKRLDDDRYARKFTPRKPDSRWSPGNRKRYAQLKASGRLTLSGLQRAPTDRRYDAPRSSPSKVPQYIQHALKSRPAVWNYFQRLAPSHRCRYVLWIDSAKREQTRTRRLEEALGLLAAGKTLGLK